MKLFFREQDYQLQPCPNCGNDSVTNFNIKSEMISTEDKESLDIWGVCLKCNKRSPKLSESSDWNTITEWCSPFVKLWNETKKEDMQDLEECSEDCGSCECKCKHGAGDKE